MKNQSPKNKGLIIMKKLFLSLFLTVLISVNIMWAVFINIVYCAYTEMNRQKGEFVFDAVTIGSTNYNTITPDYSFSAPENPDRT